MADHHRDVEVHLATCPECSGELAQYREVMGAVASLQAELEPVPPGFVSRVVARVEEERDRSWARRAATVVRDRRVQVAVASLGGAVLGAGAIALVVWRAGRRVPRAA